MHPIQATYRDGQLELLQPVDWPNGTRAEVIPLSTPSSGSAWPKNYFNDTAGALAGEDFERPSQGDLPTRETW